MEMTVSVNDNINGTLILPLVEGTESIPEDCERGLPQAMKAQINRVLSDGDFKGKAKSTISLVGGEDGKIILAGLGTADSVSAHDYRKAGAAVFATIKKIHGNDFTVRFSNAGVAHMAAFAEGMMLRDYSYNHYKMKDDDSEDDESIKQVRLACSEKEAGELTTMVENYRGVAKGVHLSRDLGNCPPNDMYPEEFADRAYELSYIHISVTTRLPTIEYAVLFE